MSTRSFTVLPVLGLAAVFAGCHTKTPMATPSAMATEMRAPAVTPPPPAPPVPPRMPAASPRALTEDELFARKSLDDLNAEHPLGDAFFDYDQSTLRDDARAALQRDAQWLNRWRTTKVTVQGQCDERGSAEYNLALGERRARAVESYLASLGVADSRVTVISLGKESPVCQEETEACWSRNRRGHFVITGK
ncbi:MAG: peptidoglycan-associated lipoprotein Pal [Acidobacteria bacterium]|nr:peptidoglycan-associated lipoprotein Pal [Acidobacteriota bacterium]